MLDTGATALAGRLLALYKTHKAGFWRVSREGYAAMLDAYRAWLEDITDRANRDGPEGHDFMHYLATVRRVALGNNPRIPNWYVDVDELFMRALSPRREARAYAKVLAEERTIHRSHGLPPLPAFVEAAIELAITNAKGKGRGDDPRISWHPARDHALLRAYEAGITATDLLDDKGMRQAIMTYVPDIDDYHPADHELFSTEQALYKVLARARRARDIEGQCYAELALLCDFLPHLTPPHLIAEERAAADWLARHPSPN